MSNESSLNVHSCGTVGDGNVQQARVFNRGFEKKNEHILPRNLSDVFLDESQATVKDQCLSFMDLQGLNSIRNLHRHESVSIRESITAEVCNPQVDLEDNTL